MKLLNRDEAWKEYRAKYEPDAAWEMNDPETLFKAGWEARKREMYKLGVGSWLEAELAKWKA